MDGKPTDQTPPNGLSDQPGQGGGPPLITTGPRKEGEPVVAAVGEGGDSLQEDKVAKEGNDEYWMKFKEEIRAEKEAIEAGGIEKLETGEAPIPPKPSIKFI